MKYLYKDYSIKGYSIKTRISFEESQYCRAAKIKYCYDNFEKKERKQKRYSKQEEEKVRDALFKDSSSLEIIVTGLGKNKTMKKIKRIISQYILQEIR